MKILRTKAVHKATRKYGDVFRIAKKWLNQYFLAQQNLAHNGILIQNTFVSDYYLLNLSIYYL